MCVGYSWGGALAVVLAAEDEWAWRGPTLLVAPAVDKLLKPSPRWRAAADLRRCGAHAASRVRVLQGANDGIVAAKGVVRWATDHKLSVKTLPAARHELGRTEEERKELVDAVAALAKAARGRERKGAGGLARTGSAEGGGRESARGACGRDVSRRFVLERRVAYNTIRTVLSQGRQRLVNPPRQNSTPPTRWAATKIARPGKGEEGAARLAGVGGARLDRERKERRADRRAARLARLSTVTTTPLIAPATDGNAQHALFVCATLAVHAVFSAALWPAMRTATTANGAPAARASGSRSSAAAPAAHAPAKTRRTPHASKTRAISSVVHSSCTAAAHESSAPSSCCPRLRPPARADAIAHSGTTS